MRSATSTAGSNSPTSPGTTSGTRRSRSKAPAPRQCRDRRGGRGVTCRLIGWWDAVRKVVRQLGRQITKPSERRRRLCFVAPKGRRNPDSEAKRSQLRFTFVRGHCWKNAGPDCARLAENVLARVKSNAKLDLIKINHSLVFHCKFLRILPFLETHRYPH